MQVGTLSYPEAFERLEDNKPREHNRCAFCPCTRKCKEKQNVSEYYTLMICRFLINKYLYHTDEGRTTCFNLLLSKCFSEMDINCAAETQTTHYSTRDGPLVFLVTFPCPFVIAKLRHTKLTGLVDMWAETAN